MPTISPVWMCVVFQMTVVVLIFVDRENLGKPHSAGMLTCWRFWLFSDTIKWLLSWAIHGRLKSSRLGAVTPSRGAFIVFIYLELIVARFWEMGKMCDRLVGE